MMQKLRVIAMACLLTLATACGEAAGRIMDSQFLPVAATEKDGRYLVFVATCDDALLDGISLSLSYFPSDSGTTNSIDINAEPVVENPDLQELGRIEPISSDNGVKTYDVTDVIARSVRPPSDLGPDDELLISYRSRNGIRFDHQSLVDGRWKKFPIASTTDFPPVSRNLKKSPVGC